MKIGRGIYNFSIFDNKNVICGTSTKHIGAIKDKTGLKKENLRKFANILEIDFNSIVFPNQTHSSSICFIDGSNKPILNGVDGLFTNKKNVFLGTLTADCMSICFYDKALGLIGIVHAGYKGLLNGIILKMVKVFKKRKSDVGKIKIAIGPAIGICCYDVDSERVKMFRKKLNKLTTLEKRNGKYFLDLKTTAVNILLSSGVKKQNIEVSPACTKDKKEFFFSYRRDKNNLERRFATIIGQV